MLFSVAAECIPIDTAVDGSVERFYMHYYTCGRPGQRRQVLECVWWCGAICCLYGRQSIVCQPTAFVRRRWRRSEYLINGVINLDFVVLWLCEILLAQSINVYRHIETDFILSLRNYTRCLKNRTATVLISHNFTNSQRSLLFLAWKYLIQFSIDYGNFF